MTRPSKISLIVFIAGLALGAAIAPAQEAEQAVPGDGSSAAQEPALQTGAIARFGRDVHVRPDERAEDIAVFFGNVMLEGAAEGDVAVFFGSLSLAGSARVEGDVAVVGGTLTVDSGATVDGDLAVIGGRSEASADFAPNGDWIVLGPQGSDAVFGSLLTWLAEGLLWGRPIVPGLLWVWIAVALMALVYLVINVVFEQPVRECADVLASKPLTACLAGVLVLLLIGPVSLLLSVSVIGLPVVPFLWFALLLVGIFGRVGVVRWLGGRLVAEEIPGDRLQATRSLALGLGVICLVYMVPLVGFVAWAAIGVIGLGAAAAAVLEGIRREHPRRRSPEPTLPPPPPGSAVAGAAGSESLHPLPSPPLATFGSRLGALLIDIVLVMIAAALIGIDGGTLFVVFVIYHVALWAWRSATVGGIVCRIRIVRADGSPLEFTDALVRSLASILSAAVAGLGWFWMLWDPRRQGWHDRIANTYVVRALPTSPPGSAVPPEGSAPVDPSPVVDVRSENGRGADGS